MIRILVTGSSGFIGHQVLKEVTGRYFFDEIEIITWDRFIHGSLLNQSNIDSSLREISPDLVLHLAWASTAEDEYDLDKSHEKWAQASIDLMRSCLANNLRIFLMGSVVDGQKPSSLDTNYVASKIKLRSAVQEFLDSGKVTLIRPHYILSPENLRPRLARLAFDTMSGNLEFEPQHPNSFVDYVHIDDVATAIWEILLGQLTGIQDICTGILRNPFELASAIGRFHKIENQERISNRASFKLGPTNSDLNSLGWSAKFTETFFGSSFD